MLKYYKMNEEVKEPLFSTEGSACFDLHVYLPTVYSDSTDNFITVYGRDNQKQERKYYQKSKDYGSFITCVEVKPGERALIPTGLIFDIPSGYSMRIHPRSSTALKRGFICPNSSGVIDEDYYHQTFMMVMNVTNEPQWLSNGERLCQAELVKTLDYSLEETTIVPSQTTERVGGFGSTGK